MAFSISAYILNEIEKRKMISLAIYRLMTRNFVSIVPFM